MCIVESSMSNPTPNLFDSNAAVRSFTPDIVPRATIEKLLDCAVKAPTAMHMEPWAFVVIQDKALLKKISDRAKELTLKNAHKLPPDKREYLVKRSTDPDKNMFYNASTLVVVCGKNIGPFVMVDCWLAAENLMLAAAAEKLGTCVIGLAITALNEPDLKKELGIPDDMEAYAPLIVGTPSEEKPVKSRKPPEILSWL